ncbi:hypothetical protein EDD86DRAFT_220204 [Gorgonomyces haynaldii]|nr:hypothetical protein EDD86DRAFT_220204 [Gorgonomyces haynaldii]
MQRFDPSKEQYDHDALLNNFDAPQERNQTVIVTRQYTEMPSELTLDVESRGRMENPKHARVQSRIHTEKVRRYCCGCFSKRSTCCAVWLSIVFVILALLGVAGFLLYPRFPTLEISDPFSPPGSQGLQISPSGSLTDNLRNASPERPFSMSIPYAVNVSLYSPNYIDIYTSVMELKVSCLRVGKLSRQQRRSDPHVFWLWQCHKCCVQKQAKDYIYTPSLDPVPYNSSRVTVFGSSTLDTRV